MHPPLETVRQRRLGGTTGAWGGRCVPLDEIDFERRDYVRESGWPISREDLLPYYRRAQRYCEAGAFDYKSGTSLPGAPPFLLSEGARARFTDDKLVRYSPPTDFGTRYKAKLESSRNLRVFHHANVLCLESDSTGTRAEAALVASAPGREFRVEAQLFILAGGGLETTRLLLVSSQRAGRPFGSGHALLGRHYMTHLDGFVGKIRFSGPAPPSAHSYERTSDGVYCRRMLGLTEKTMRTEGLQNFTSVLYMPAPDDPSHGDALLSAYALVKETLFRTRTGFKSRRHGLSRSVGFSPGSHLRNVLRDPASTAAFAFKWSRDRWLATRKVPSFLTTSRSGEYRFLFSAEQSPSSANRITLSDEVDEFGVPRLVVRWGVARSDHESIVRTLSIIGSEIERLGAGSVMMPSSPDDLAAAIGGGFLGGTHAMGTTRMSGSPRTGVVGPDCRIHGVANVYIASSAVFPTGGFAAPTLTIVAMAIKVADKIQSTLSPQSRAGVS